MWCVYSFTGYFPIRMLQSIRTTQSKANKTFIDLWILFRFSSLHTQNFSTNKTLLLFLAFWSLVFHWTNKRHAIWWSLPRPWNGHNHVKKENKIGGARIYTAVKLLTVLYCHWLHFHLAQIGWASFFVCVLVALCRNLNHQLWFLEQRHHRPLTRFQDDYSSFSECFVRKMRCAFFFFCYSSA